MIFYLVINILKAFSLSCYSAFEYFLFVYFTNMSKEVSNLWLIFICLLQVYPPHFCYDLAHQNISNLWFPFSPVHSHFWIIIEYSAMSAHNPYRPLWVFHIWTTLEKFRDFKFLTEQEIYLPHILMCLSETFFHLNSSSIQTH